MYVDKFMTRGIYLLLGSNQGDKRQFLSLAETLLKTEVGNVVARSSIYITEAWGIADQPDFVNQVLEIETSLDPAHLLTNILEIENKIGRERVEKWGPRVIDIDILYFDVQIVSTKDLQIPHPEIQNRMFTLVPLCEIAPEFLHPVLHKTNKTLLEESSDTLAVRRIH